MFNNYIEKKVLQEEWDQIHNRQDVSVISKSDKIIIVIRDLTIFESIATFFQLLGYAVRSLFCKETNEENRQSQLAKDAFMDGKYKCQVELVAHVPELIDDVQRLILERLSPKDIQACACIRNWNSEASKLFLWKLKAKQIGCPLKLEGNQAESAKKAKKTVNEYIQEIRNKARYIQRYGLVSRVGFEEIFADSFAFLPKIETLCKSDKIEDIIELRDWVINVRRAQDTAVVRCRLAQRIGENVPIISSIEELLQVEQEFENWCTMHQGSLNSIQRLNLMSLSLQSVPSAIKKLRNLKQLFLSNNAFYTFPAEVCEITKLNVLDLSLNKISQLPSAIGQLKDLKSFNLDGNRIFSLPPEVGELKNLSTLVLANNKLSDLPSKMYGLTQLKRLVLSANRFTELDPKIGDIADLAKLILRGNPISKLPQEISRLTHLRKLDLSSTKIYTIPLDIFQSPHLTIEGAIIAETKNVFCLISQFFT